jgi:hypothetical protein
MLISYLFACTQKKNFFLDPSTHFLVMLSMDITQLPPVDRARTRWWTRHLSGCDIVGDM